MSPWDQAITIATLALLAGALIAALLKLKKGLTEERLLEFCNNDDDWLPTKNPDEILKLLNVFDLSKFNFYDRPAAVIAIERNDDGEEFRYAGVYAHYSFGGETQLKEHAFYLFRNDQVSSKNAFHVGKSMIWRHFFKWQSSVQLSVESEKHLKFKKWHVEGRGHWLLLYRPFYSPTWAVFREELTLSFEAYKLIRNDMEQKKLSGFAAIKPAD